MNSPVERTRLPGPVQAIAWNADFSNIAVSHCGNDVVIYAAAFSSSGAGGSLAWNKVATLQGHHQLVSGLDWAPKADQILSCSHDRNAFVWTRTAASTAAKVAATSTGSVSGVRMGSVGSRAAGASPNVRARAPSAPEPASTSEPKCGSWEKQMVITRLTKGALCVRWSPSEAKFAIGSAARVVSVGYYDPESKWWACKMIRKAHESSVVAVAWHPNSLLLATGSTDRRVRLFNAYVQGYESEASPGCIPPNSAFGDCLFEVSHEGCGWVHGIAWSPGDDALLYASHDSAVGFVRGPKAEVAVRLSGPNQLPLKCLALVSERLAVGAGWDGCLLVLARKSVQEPWRQVAVLDGSTSSSSSSGGGSGAGAGGVVRQLAQMHLGSSTPGTPGSKAAGRTGQPSCHTACVTGLHARPAAAAARGAGIRWHAASAGLDGQVILWDLSSFL